MYPFGVDIYVVGVGPYVCFI